MAQETEKELPPFEGVKIRRVLPTPDSLEYSVKLKEATETPPQVPQAPSR